MVSVEGAGYSAEGYPRFQDAVPSGFQDAVPARFQDQVPPGPPVVPPRRWPRAVRRVLLAIIFGLLVGFGAMLQWRGWSAVSDESGGDCGGEYGSCPKGSTPALIISFFVLFAAVPLSIGVSIWKPKIFALLNVLAIAAGLPIGNTVYTWWHGTDLSVVWSAPYDSTDTLRTQGVWLTGSTIIRARVDQLTSYDDGTGKVDWTFPIPGQEVVCGMSRQTSAGIGLVTYGPDSGPCGQLVAIDLGTGRQLWAKDISGDQDQSSNTSTSGGGSTVSDPDMVDVAGGTAMVVTAAAVTGYDLHSGTQTWRTPAPDGCGWVLETAGHGQDVALASCDTGVQVLDLDPATGSTRWHTLVMDPGGQSVSVAVVATNPVVLEEKHSGARPVDIIDVFDANGRPGASFRVDSVDTPDGPVQLDTSRYNFDAAPLWWTFADSGLLVGVTKEVGGHVDAVGYSLATGKPAWVTQLPDNADAVTEDAGRLLVLDDASPSPIIDAIAVRTGAVSEVGQVPASAVAQSLGIYPMGGGDFALVATSGTNPNAPVVVVHPS